MISQVAVILRYYHSESIFYHLCSCTSKELHKIFLSETPTHSEYKNKITSIICKDKNLNLDLLTRYYTLYTKRDIWWMRLGRWTVLYNVQDYLSFTKLMIEAPVSIDNIKDYSNQIIQKYNEASDLQRLKLLGISTLKEVWNDMPLEINWDNINPNKDIIRSVIGNVPKLWKTMKPYAKRMLEFDSSMSKNLAEYAPQYVDPSKLLYSDMIEPWCTAYMNLDLNAFIQSLISHPMYPDFSIHRELSPKVLSYIINYGTSNTDRVHYSLKPFVDWHTNPEHSCWVFARLVSKRYIPSKQFILFILHSFTRISTAIGYLVYDNKGFNAIVALINYDKRDRVRNYCETLDVDTPIGRRLKRFLEWT